MLFVEKRKAHYPLTKVKLLIQDRRVEFTMTAVTGIESLLIISFKEKDE